MIANIYIYIYIYIYIHRIAINAVMLICSILHFYFVIPIFHFMENITYNQVLKTENNYYYYTIIFTHIINIFIAHKIYIILEKKMMTKLYFCHLWIYSRSIIY